MDDETVVSDVSGWRISINEDLEPFENIEDKDEIPDKYSYARVQKLVDD